MAYCRLGHIKAHAGAGGLHTGLKNCLEYIYNPLKTENNKYIGGYNILPNASSPGNSCYYDMVNLKQAFAKEDGRQGYHFKLSFPADEKVSPELALKITDEFCSRAFTHYQCAYAVHTNTKHLHSHIVFNSIDMYEGKKYHYKKGDWANIIQPIANDICNKYGLSSLSLNLDEELRLSHRCKNYNKWLKDNKKPKNNPGYTNVRIRADVDECISKSKDFNQFLENMTNKGHIVNVHEKYITIKAPGRERACRSYNLSADKSTYSTENIIRMIDGTYLSASDIKTSMLNDWRKYLSEKTLAIKRKRVSPELARKIETKTFQLNHNIYDLDSANYYRYYLDTVDKQLNRMRKYINNSLDSKKQAFDILDEILKLEKSYTLYIKTGAQEYKEAYMRAGDLYSELRKRYDIVELFKYRIEASELLKDIDDYKKHIYVEKKVCDRLTTEIKQKKQIKQI